MPKLAYNCALDMLENSHNLFILLGWNPNTTELIPTASLISSENAARIVAGQLFNIFLNETAVIDEDWGEDGFCNVTRPTGFFAYPAHVTYPDNGYNEILICCHIRDDEVPEHFMEKLNSAINPWSDHYDKDLHHLIALTVADITFDNGTIRLFAETSKTYTLTETEDGFAYEEDSCPPTL